MIGHDLIEQVGGIEKAKAIVVGASFGTHYRVDTGEVICCHNESHFYFTDLVKLGVEFIRIDDLRTAIAQYDSNPSNSRELESDDVKDIRNHISPNMRVFDLDAEEELMEGMRNG